MKTLELFYKYRKDIDHPWAWCTKVIHLLTRRREVIGLEEDNEKKKIQHETDVREWLTSFVKGKEV